MLKLAIFVSVPFFLGLFAFYAAISPSWRLPVVKRLALVGAYCMGVTFFSPSVPIHLALCSLTVPLFAHRREDIPPVYLFGLLALPSLQLSIGVGSIQLLPITGFSALGIGALVWATVKGERGDPKSYLAGICIAALFCMIVFGAARGTSATNYLRVIVNTSLSFLMPFYIVRRCVKSPNDARLLIVGLIAVTAALSAVAIYEAKASWPLFRGVYNHYGITLSSGASVKLRGGYLRSPGTFIEPTSFALWLAIGTGALLASPWLFRSKVNYTLLRVFLLAGLFAPQSRGAFIGLIVFFAVHQLVNGRSVNVVKPAFFAGGAALMFYCLALFVPAIGNMVGLNSTGAVNRDYRQDLFSRGIEEAKHHLILGTDYGSVTYALRDLVQGEGIVDFVNSYLSTLLVTGLVGLFLFVFALFAPLPAMYRLARSSSAQDRAAPAFVVAALGSMIVMIAFTALGGRTISGICILIGLSGSLLNARRSATARSGDRVLGGRANMVPIGGPPSPDKPIVHHTV